MTYLSRADRVSNCCQDVMMTQRWQESWEGGERVQREKEEDTWVNWHMGIPVPTLGGWGAKFWLERRDWEGGRVNIFANDTRVYLLWLIRENGVCSSWEWGRCQAVVAHACNPSTLGGRGSRISEFEASLVYRVSSRAIQRNPVSKKPKSKKNYFIVTL